jgi:hypothetical protein
MIELYGKIKRPEFPLANFGGGRGLEAKNEIDRRVHSIAGI